MNMNDRCRVTLTAVGAAQYNEWDVRTKHLNWGPKNLQTGDVLVEQMWQLFQIFGPHIYLGMPEAPFVGNTIEVVE